ncbi:MAG: hypothetical protein WA705_23120 [Candidatus Ozemobacteraceae bacterium]
MENFHHSFLISGKLWGNASFGSLRPLRKGFHEEHLAEKTTARREVAGCDLG